MFGNYVYVELVKTPNSNRYPTAKKIKQIFRAYGRVHEILSHRLYNHFFFVIYEGEEFALECVKHRKSLYRKHGFIVEHAATALQEEEFNGGRAIPNVPSLLDLNDDCLLEIISLVPQSLKNVCTRLRRLYLSHNKKRILVDESLSSVDRVFHFGDQLKHLSVVRFKDCFEDILRMMLLRCTKLESLELKNCECAFDERIIKHMKGIAKRLKDLKKIRISGQGWMWQGYHDFIEIQSLTTVILPKAHVDFGHILSGMPQLRELSCTYAHYATSPLPTDHGLIELDVTLYSANAFGDMTKIRQTCGNLRHLRINFHKHALVKKDDDKLLSIMMKMHPLEGLYLTDMPLTSDFFSLFADCLKILLLDSCRCPNDFELMLAEFSKLEVLSWNNISYKTFDAFLKKRQPSHLTIVSGDASVHARNYSNPLVKWVEQPKDIFGPFSIYGDIYDE